VDRATPPEHKKKPKVVEHNGEVPERPQEPHGGVKKDWNFRGGSREKDWRLGESVRRPHDVDNQWKEMVRYDRGGKREKRGRKKMMVSMGY